MAEPQAWRRSSRCQGSACVEVATTEQTVHVRHSADPDGPKLVVSREVWAAFLERVKQGDFDQPIDGNG
jgi:Domain of unknown function (DUF397)